MKTLAERIAEACCPEAWCRARTDQGDDSKWNDPAAVAERTAIQAACERAIQAANGNMRAMKVADLKRLAGLSQDDVAMVEGRMLAAGR